MVNLARLVASATHLIESEVEAQRSNDLHAASAIKPVCTEPYCGGFWWAQRPKSPKIELAEEKEKEREPVPVDFPDVSFYPAFDPPIASQVQLQRANRGYYDRWNVPNAITLTIDSMRDLKFFVHEVLNNFMRVQEDAGLGHPERVVRQGLQLISWKPAGGRLHVTPFLGSKREIMTSSLPIRLTFGGKPTTPKEGGLEPEVPDAPDYGRYLREEDLPQQPIVMPVKRLDFVLHRRQTDHHPMFEEPPVPEEVKLERELVAIHTSDTANSPRPGANARATQAGLSQAR
ncbi:unnamed protein product [Symbiodinium natans]|uniref:Uncharacterized protein n=1 Tax=Symbiodinium natans TaxID=878477 RepID=A0A812RSI9_9DINO|nr:unnamed protein product [Symbiodinium natans]